MNKGGIIRIIIYFIIVGVLCFLAVGNCCEIYCDGIQSVNTEGTDIVVDGADFSPLVMFLGYGFNGFLSLMFAGIYAIVIMIASVICLVPFRLIGLNKKRIVSQTEYEIYKNSLIVLSVASVLLSGILSGFKGLLLPIIYNGLWVVFVLGLVVLPAGRRKSS